MIIKEKKKIVSVPLKFVDINECAPDPCQNGATCADLVGSYRCDCKAGYTGSNCETSKLNITPSSHGLIIFTHYLLVIPLIIEEKKKIVSVLFLNRRHQ